MTEIQNMPFGYDETSNEYKPIGDGTTLLIGERGVASVVELPTVLPATGNKPKLPPIVDWRSQKSGNSGRDRLAGRPQL